MRAAVYHGYDTINRYVVNHDIMNCTADGVVGNHLYSGRALGLTEPWDIIQLHPDLKSDWSAIQKHYRRIHIKHTKEVIWDLDLNHLSSQIGFQPSVFYFGPHEYRYWGDFDWLKTVEFINSKNNFMHVAKELEIPTPETHCFNSSMEIGIQAFMQFSFPCYVKAAISVSGVGIYRCETPLDLFRSLKKFDPAIPIQIQEEVLTDSFLNMQYRIVGKNLIRLEASEQILDGFVHQGNRVPVEDAPWEIVDPMAEWLLEQGMKGIFAFDVARTKTPDGYDYTAIECNPRYNGASYPTLIAKKLNIPEWISLTLDTDYRKLDDIDLDGIEFDPRAEAGVIIINWGTISQGKLMFLIAGSKSQQNFYVKQLEERLAL